MIFSEDAEKGVLCSLLLSPRETSDLCEDLLPEAFYIRAHQIVYGVLRENIQTLSVGDRSYVNDARATLVYPPNLVEPIALDAQIKLVRLSSSISNTLSKIETNWSRWADQST